MANESLSGVTIVETVELVGPAGKAVVNKTDVDEWVARGYAPVGQPATAPDHDPDPASDPAE